MDRSLAQPAAFALLVLLAVSPPCLATPGEPKPERIQKQIVVRDDDEKQIRVFSWNGDEGETPEILLLDGEGPDGGFGFVMGRTKGGYLGVDLVDLTPDLRTHFGAPRDAGVMVGMVEPDSPAAAAGLVVGDIITSFGDEPAVSSWKLGVAIRRGKQGEAAALEVYRNGEARQLTATLAERDRRLVELPRHPALEDGLLDELPPHTLGPVVKRLERLRAAPGSMTMIHPRSQREEELQTRLEDLEKRLQELEKRLAAAGGK